MTQKDLGELFRGGGEESDLEPEGTETHFLAWFKSMCIDSVADLGS